jgi:Glycosyl transferase family group 2
MLFELAKKQKITGNSTILQDRTTILYRFLESLLALSVIATITLFIIFSIFLPVIACLIIIIFGLIWVFKYLLITVYSIFTFIQFNRWKKINWQMLIDNFHELDLTLDFLTDLRNKHSKKSDWVNKINQDILARVNLEQTKFIYPKSVVQVCVFATYNEGLEVLLKSLEYLYNSQWELEKLIVIISQEQRRGIEENKILRDQIGDVNWINSKFLDIEDMDIVKNLLFDNSKLNVFFTEHPDGLVGEIKGKASNENWGAIKAESLLKLKEVDLDMVIVTSLDADSHIGKFFFHNLAYRFCLAENRFQAGFQPVHLYVNNYDRLGTLPRQIAFQNIMSNLTNLTLEGELSFFAIYSVPLRVLQKVGFWEKEVCAEDYMIFIKCLKTFNGDFHVIPHFGVMYGDGVEADDYIEELSNQYKQYQRWAWGGVEGIPYLVKHFFLTKESSQIGLRKKLKWLYLSFANHYFWVVSPLAFSIAPFLPFLLQNPSFRSLSIADNLIIFTQYFSWVSLIMISITIFIILQFISKDDPLINRKKNYWIVIIEYLISPLIFVLLAIPAIDAQFRGLLGKYLGYWVTPKK